MLNETTHIDYNLEIVFVGIFGRNRKPKFDSLRLARVAKEDPQPSLDELKTLFYAKIAEIKAKPGSKVAIKSNPVDIRDGFETVLLSTLSAPPLHSEVL